MTILEIMTSDPACCTPDTTLKDCARMMVEYNCGEIPVCDSRDKGHIVGVVTDRDIVCRAVAEGMDMNRTPVSQCMSTPPVTIKPNMTLDEAIQLMEKNMIRRLPVTDENDCVCGMLSQADIACHGDRDLLTEVVQEISQPTEEPSRVTQES